MGENHTIDFLQACFTRYRDHQNFAQKKKLFFIDFIVKKTFVAKNTTQEKISNNFKITS